MHRTFEYRTVEVVPSGWSELGGLLAERCAERAAARGGALYGVWIGQIGLARDEGIVMTAWPSLEEARRHGEDSIAVDGVSPGQPVYLEATVRPSTDEQPRRPGYYAHRWFELDETDWPEFLHLSSSGWPSLEAAVDAHILGFWRQTRGVEPGMARVLLLTQYATLSDWEHSRWWGRPDPRAKEAMERFRHRSTLVRRTHVVISTPPPSWSL